MRIRILNSILDLTANVLSNSCCQYASQRSVSAGELETNLAILHAHAETRNVFVLGCFTRVLSTSFISCF